MARNSGNSLLTMAAAGVFGYAVYQLIQPIIHGAARAASPAAPGQPGVGSVSVGAAPDPSAGWYQLNLTDLGGVPLEMQGGRVRQSARWIAAYSPGSPINEYSPGAVFLDSSGATWQWTGGDQLAATDPALVGNTTNLGAFA